MRNFNATMDGQEVTLQEAGLYEGYRLGPFGYCGGHFVGDSFHESSCVDVHGLEMDLNKFFRSQTNVTVPAPEISGQRVTSKFLHDGLIAAATFSLICLILDLFVFRFVQSVHYTPTKLKLSLCAIVTSIISQTVVWTLMCAASTESLGLAINIDEGFWELGPYPGIIASIGITFFVLIRISFTFGLISSVAKSLLVISYYRMRTGNNRR
jgi:hypothetical protein